jgi:hypothetical protein
MSATVPFQLHASSILDRGGFAMTQGALGCIWRQFNIIPLGNPPQSAAVIGPLQRIKREHLDQRRGWFDRLRLVRFRLARDWLMTDSLNPPLFKM